jgi:parallel beta-helix repeat protein
LLAVCSTLSAATINVPGDFGTIQGAIADAGTVNGDEIVVQPGTYPEAIDFLGKAITVRSASGDPADTIIDGTGNFHVVQCVNGESSSTVLSGFTITGGNANGTDPNDRGGGMLNLSSSPTVTNCFFKTNSADSFGGGIFSSNGSPTVTFCLFSGNSASSGAGMYNNITSTTVTHCTFIGNLGSTGGGMTNQNPGSPVMTNCVFSGNTGDGMRISNNCTPVVTNCTFSDNTGHGIFHAVNVSGNAQVANTIVWGNILGGITDNAATTTVIYSDVQGGELPGAGNISSDPQFIDAAGGNLRLQAGSPASDSGDNSAVPVGVTTDLDGNARIINGTVDMGAYELGDRVHNLTQDSLHDTLQEAIDAAVNDDEIEADLGTYNEIIDFLGKAITLRSTDPTNPVVVATTIIDATLAADPGDGKPVVRCDTFETAATVLEGFTITGGTGDTVLSANGYGGGMFNNDTSPTVTYCTFSGNTTFVGGGMYNDLNFGGNPTVTHCTFSGNTASNLGGGMGNSGGSPPVTNCTFSGNTASGIGGGMYNTSISAPTVTNCIFWGNSPDGIGNFISGGSTPTVSSCDVQGVLPAGTVDGGGNINTNPFFVDADGPDNTAGTEDDNLRLQSGSPCIDAGDNTAVPAGITTDLDGNLRFIDGPPLDTGIGTPPLVDMGVYEYGSAPTPCVSQLEGDINCDGIVNELDFVLMALNWLETI